MQPPRRETSSSDELVAECPVRRGHEAQYGDAGDLLAKAVPIRSFRSTSRQVSLCVLGRRQLRPLDPQSAMSRFHASQHGADIALTSLNRSGHLPQSQRVSRGL